MNPVARRSLLDKFILSALGVFFLLQKGFEEQMVVFLLFSFCISLLSLLTKQPRFSVVSLLLLSVLSNWWPEFCYFLPVIVYDAFLDESYVSSLLSGGILVLFFLMNPHFSVEIIGAILLVCVISGYLAARMMQEQALQRNYQKLEVASLETTFFLEAKNKKLIEQQETKIALEISDEQNRIARDIHDTVGHLLSSSLLQVGAIRTLNRERGLEKLLELLQKTIDEGMNNIRDSVHNLHDESLSLSRALEKLIQQFTFCEVVLKGAVLEEISKDYKMAYLMVVKESLANIMKHSNASLVTVEFQNYPGFYKLTIIDNGTFKEERAFNELGMGLLGMKERMEKLNGRLSCRQATSGFSLRAILPK